MLHWFSRLFSTTDRRSRKVSPDRVAALESRQLLSANRAPVIPVGQVFHLAENNSFGAWIGKVQATDADGNAIQSFRIDYSFPTFYPAVSVDSSGQLTANWTLDHESSPEIELWVSASDGTAWSNSTAVRVVVDNVNEPPQRSGSIGNFKGATGKNDLIVTTSVTLGKKLGSIDFYDPDLADRTLQLSVTGKLSTAVAFQKEKSDGNLSTYKLVVAKPELLKKGTTTRWTITAQDSAGQVVTQSVDLVIANDLQTITTPENPTVRKTIGQLPSNYRKARTSYYILGGARSATTGDMVSVGANGDIIARPTETSGYPGPIAINDIAYPWHQPYDFESTQQQSWYWYQGTQLSDPAVPRVNAPWGEVLVAALSQTTGKVQYIVVNIQLSDVDEKPTLYDQSIEVGRDGTGGLVWFTDPDKQDGFFYLVPNNPVMIVSGFVGTVGTSTSGTFLSTSGPHEMRIVAGDDQGIFTFEPDNVVRWGSTMRMKIAKPHLLAGRTNFTLKVQLLEKGQVASEATVRVTVTDRVIVY
jgi:hypothetical protein